MSPRVVRLRLLPLFVIFSLLSACREDDPSPADSNPHAKVNDWIYENMDFWYLWDTELPASPNKEQAPDAFFESLLSNKDRFSWIQDNFQELLNSLQGVSKEAGYEFVLYRASEANNDVIAQVIYVKANSPAANQGLKRGDVITHINGEKMTTDNYQTLLGGIGENHSVRYRPLDVEAQSFGTDVTVNLVPVQYAENPNHLHSIIDVDGHKIGYYVYTFFANGTDASPDAYTTEMDAIFDEFKAAGITDLVLDLRFNSGGAETAASNLASLIGKGVDASKVFAKRNYNAAVQQAILNDPELGTNFLNPKFATKAGNVGSQLAGGRVYVLTSSRTASASELVINALKPFMDVFLIGDVTYGKNVGSITLYEENDPENKWGMQPIVVKIANSLNQSDYEQGFSPNVENKDNNLYLYPLGDVRESMLSQAIGQITGTAGTGRLGKQEKRELVGHSLDFKRRSFNLIVEDFPVTRPVQ